MQKRIIIGIAGADGKEFKDVAILPNTRAIDDVRRAELLRSVFTAVVIGPEGVLGFTLKPPFDTLSPGPKPDSANRVRDVAERILDAA